MPLEEELNRIFNEAKRDFENVFDLENLEKLRIKYLGRKSYLANFPEILKKLSIEEKRKLGKLYNELKEKINNFYLEKKSVLSEEKIRFDLDHPGKKIILAKEHLISKTIQQISQIFTQLGFSIVDEKEIVDEKYNFDFLNIPTYHPARDLWDTLWLKNKKLLRTHTTAFQVPLFRKFKPPIKAITFGKVFRYEATDRTHDFEFYQFDGVSVGENINLGNLRYIVEKFFENFFHQKILIRFRPGYFPFVEPGIEIDISCIFCKQKGCSTCKKTGFIEIAGAGMIHKFVFKKAGIDYRKYQGWAFGFGIDRLIMLKHNINDIRILHSSDLRFLEQF